MWDVIGSWPVVTVVVVTGVAALVLGWWRSGRRPATGLAAVLVGMVAVTGIGLVMIVPVTVDGATCVNRATPYGVNHTDLDAATASELGLDRFACRDALRTRYVIGGVGYLAITLGAAAIMGRSRRLVR